MTKLAEERTLVYAEDDQYYTSTLYLFKTDCPWTMEELRKLSFERSVNPAAGRFSTTFNDFQKGLIRNGFTCLLVEKFPELVKGYDIVFGAEGNY